MGADISQYSKNAKIPIKNRKINDDERDDEKMTETCQMMSLMSF